jgi:hypothetical protein
MIGKLSVQEQTYQAVLAVLADGRSATAVACHPTSASTTTALPSRSSCSRYDSGTISRTHQY